MRLKTTKRQSQTLAALLAQLCELYNMALEQRRNAYRECGVTVTAYDQMRQLTVLRAELAEYADLPVAIQRDSLRRAQHAFNAFFRRVKSGQTPGYPRFRSVSRYDSFTVNAERSRFTEDGKLKIDSLGHFRVKTRCDIRGELKALRIKRCGQHWTAQAVCDIGPVPEKVAVRSAVGIDLGLTTLATLSDGTEIENPRWTKQEEDRLAGANRSLASKKRGSNNRAKACEALRRCHQRIHGLRHSYLHEASRYLVGSYDLIAYEGLKIIQMARGRFAKSIMDAAWGELIHQLKYKAESAGTYAVAVNPRGTTQRCSGCGEIVPKGLSQRQHNCPKCGLSLGRDHNAALNVLNRGVRSVAIAARGFAMNSTP